MLGAPRRPHRRARRLAPRPGTAQLLVRVLAAIRLRRRPLLSPRPARRPDRPRAVPRRLRRPPPHPARACSPDATARPTPVHRPPLPQEHPHGHPALPPRARARTAAGRSSSPPGSSPSWSSAAPPRRLRQADDRHVLDPRHPLGGGRRPAAGALPRRRGRLRPLDRHRRGRRARGRAARRPRRCGGRRRPGRATSRPAAGRRPSLDLANPVVAAQQQRPAGRPRAPCEAGGDRARRPRGRRDALPALRGRPRRADLLRLRRRHRHRRGPGHPGRRARRARRRPRRRPRGRGQRPRHAELRAAGRRVRAASASPSPWPCSCSPSARWSPPACPILTALVGVGIGISGITAADRLPRHRLAPRPCWPR